MRINKKRKKNRFDWAQILKNKPNVNICNIIVLK